MFLEEEIPKAELGKHFIKPWNAEELGDVTGKTFWLAGWGASGAVNDENVHDESHH